jgi:gluconate 2-dehydrogenase gamma chain
MSDDTQSPSRRSLIKSMMFVPIGAVAATGAVRALSTATAADANAPEGKPNAYTPTFFNQVEWKFLSAAVDRLIPHDEHGPGAIELGVLEFLDRHMQTPFAAGDIWYMQGPFVQAKPEFGYQGKLALRDIIRVGIKNVDGYCASQFGGKAFADLDRKQQEEILQRLRRRQAQAGRDFSQAVLHQSAERSAQRLLCRS